MSLFVIGDLHLSFGCEKPMDVFGGRWENYTEKLLSGFSAVGPEDTTVLCGDLTWGMDFAEALEDFLFIHRLPGRKIILKGNHDYWWTTVSQAKRFFSEHGIDSIEILNNNCCLYGEMALCGTRGWSAGEAADEAHDRKMFARELLRMEASLRAAGEREKLAFLHYPPKTLSSEWTDMLDLLVSYGVTRCFYGHLHSAGCAHAFEGEYRGVRFRLVSADHVCFVPQKIL
jgi:predicted phosphohydrolase